jgi:hypothetical protein
VARLLIDKLPLIGALSGAWQSLKIRIADSYRPERH